MNRLILFLPIFVALILIISSLSHADVLSVDVTADGTRSSNSSISQHIVPTGVGEPGDFNLLLCAVPSEQGGNIFFVPTPGDWSTFVGGSCGGNGECQLGVWGTFTNNAGSENISCNWSNDVLAFGGGTFRYQGVDPEDPIIAVDCNSDSGNTFVFPSVNTEPGSQVIRALAFTSLEGASVDQIIASDNGDIKGITASQGFAAFQNIFLSAETAFFESGGPTGERVVGPIGFPADWRACTLALRMAQVTEVPTLSEWGLITFAAFAGLAGFWYLRRRQVAA